MSNLGESIPARFAAIAAAHAQRIAVSTPEVEWSYAELNARSAGVAAAVLSRAGRDDEPVALLMQHGALLIASILGVLRAGRIYAALDADSPPPRLLAVLETAGARLLLVDSANLDLASKVAGDRLAVVEVRPDGAAMSAAHNLPAVSPESGAWLMFTSGSTGQPKGVWQNHRSVIHHADVYRELIALNPEDRLTLLTSCSLAASATHLFTALLNGATLCPFLVRSQGITRLAVWLREQGISVYHSVPTVFRHLLRNVKGADLPANLRLIRLGGEPVLRGDVELFRERCPARCQLMHAYSSTESGLTCAMLLDRQTPPSERRIAVGKPVRDVEVTLLDDRGETVPHGSEGRIAVASAFLSQGYWRQEAATREAFRDDPRQPGRRIFVTSDLGRFREDGALDHLGRVDHQVKIRGQRVDLAEVEAALRATELVSDAVVVARGEAGGERCLAAYIVPRAGVEHPEHACRRALRRNLPDVMIPSVFVTLAKLPLTAGGKVDRRALPPPPKRVADPGERKIAMPRDGVERKVARVWQSVLGVPAVGRTDDFFELGGTSLQATVLMAGIEETFNVSLRTSVLVENSTVEKLAGVIADQAVVRSPTPRVAIRKSDVGRPLFFVHSGHGDVATYAQLSRRLPGRPIYGLQAVGMQGECWPLMSVRAMAQCYLTEILAAAPTGPYLIAGTCMGGLVAFEIACQLAQQKRRVGLVALLDTPAPPFSGQRSPWIEMALDPVRDTLRIARWAILRALGRGRAGASLPAYRRFIASMTSRARYYYRPGKYPGEVTVFVTRDTAFARDDRRPLMGRHAAAMRLITIPGRREELFLPPNVDELARQLQSCLDAAETSLA